MSGFRTFCVSLWDEPLLNCEASSLLIKTLRYYGGVKDDELAESIRRFPKTSLSYGVSFLYVFAPDSPRCTRARFGIADRNIFDC